MDRLSDVQRVVKRRFLLRQVGIEVFLHTDQQLFLTFASVALRYRYFHTHHNNNELFNQSIAITMRFSQH